jgi:Holliday junction resolvasome RuvABC endonuclease subunit
MGNVHDRVLAIHPTRTGFGWVLFEGSLAPVDWGVVGIGERRNARCLLRIGKLMARYSPTVIALEQFEGEPARRARRIRQLCHSIALLAAKRGIRVRVYSRDEVRACFANIGGGTRYEIAAAIAGNIEALAPHLPAPRKIWMPEDPRMGLFAAVAIAVAHFGSVHAKPFKGR